MYVPTYIRTYIRAYLYVFVFGPSELEVWNFASSELPSLDPLIYEYEYEYEFEYEYEYEYV